MHEQQTNDFPTFATVENWFWLSLRAIAIPFEVFLRRGMGWRYPGFQGVLALVAQLVFLFVAASQRQSAAPVLAFISAYFVMLVFRRAQSRRMRRRGFQCHSSYAGDPILARWLPWFSEKTIRQVVEPLVIAMAGVAVAPVSSILSVEFLAAAFCMRLSYDLPNIRLNNRVEAMNDQLVEQQIVAERFRQMSGRRF